MQKNSDLIHQANREACWAILLALGYFAWWYCGAYVFSAPKDELQLPQLYWGMPLWFVLSCVLGPILFTVICALMVKYLYKDISLDKYDDEHYE
ncbi:YhdT family protein [Vibrio natriegens]|uniref:YhdT family protein n=1 Tax=Vibrio natriegens TaxID=691 RepID=UPI0021E7AD21|nr:YhdT family protein [Vibrio natriegens]UYI48385.1 YhdT family protein [Vibrio natriegens]